MPKKSNKDIPALYRCIPGSEKIEKTATSNGRPQRGVDVLKLRQEILREIEDHRLDF